MSDEVILASGVSEKGCRLYAMYEARFGRNQSQGEPQMSETKTEPVTWAIVELMGHVRLGGRITEEEKFGAKLGRLDIPGPDGGFVTQYFGGGSVYRITIVDEAAARAVAVRTPEPVSPWELPKQLAPAGRSLSDEGRDEEDDRPF